MSDLTGIIVTSAVAVISGLFALLANIHHFKSWCCSSDCTKDNADDDEQPSIIHRGYEIESRSEMNSPLTIRRNNNYSPGTGRIRPVGDYHTSDI